jgi:hypothetical protein
MKDEASVSNLDKFLVLSYDPAGSFVLHNLEWLVHGSVSLDVCLRLIRLIAS